MAQIFSSFGFNGYHSQTFKPVSDGNGYYSILTGSSGYKSGLDVESGNTEDGTDIEQWNNWGGDCQLWYLETAK